MACNVPSSVSATLRFRIRGERTPELLLELQDDERTRTFFQHVMKAKQQGENMFWLTYYLATSHFSY